MPAGGPVRWVDGPARHEAGTPNLVGAVALAAVCDVLTGGGWVDLVAKERRLLDRLDAGLSAIAGVHRLRLFESGHPRHGITSFTVAGLDSAEVAQRLADEYGIGVRDGLSALTH